MPTIGPSGAGSDRVRVMMLAKASLGLRSVLNIGVPQQEAYQRSRFVSPKENTDNLSKP